MTRNTSLPVESQRSLEPDEWRPAGAFTSQTCSTRDVLNDASRKLNVSPVWNYGTHTRLHTQMMLFRGTLLTMYSGWHQIINQSTVHFYSLWRYNCSIPMYFCYNAKISVTATSSRFVSSLYDDRRCELMLPYSNLGICLACSLVAQKQCGATE